jgi:hypothetical protein
MEISASVDVPTTSHCDRNAVGMLIGEGEEIGTRLRNIIGVFPSQRHLFGIGQLVTRSIGFIARGDDDPFNEAAKPAACL